MICGTLTKHSMEAAIGSIVFMVEHIFSRENIAKRAVGGSVGEILSDIVMAVFMFVD